MSSVLFNSLFSLQNNIFFYYNNYIVSMHQVSIIFLKNIFVYVVINNYMYILLHSGSHTKVNQVQRNWTYNSQLTACMHGYNLCSISRRSDTVYIRCIYGANQVHSVHSQHFQTCNCKYYIIFGTPWIHSDRSYPHRCKLSTDSYADSISLVL